MYNIVFNNTHHNKLPFITIQSYYKINDYILYAVLLIFRIYLLYNWKFGALFFFFNLKCVYWDGFPLILIQVAFSDASV